jgi:integrase
MAWKKKDTSPITWMSLADSVAANVLHAPKTGGDPTGDWPQVHERIVRYFLRNIAGTLWANHLALIVAVLAARRQDVQTIRLTMMALHVRFSAIFAVAHLHTVEEWKPDCHLPPYIRGELIPGDSQYTRQQFLTRYTNAVRHIQNWLDSLPETERQSYQGVVLPPLSPFLYEQVSQRKEVKQRQEDHRKTETAAIVPHFSLLRAEAHFRLNRLERLRQAYRQALSQVLPDRSNLPLAFFYDEGDPPRERLHFRLWDRRSFVLDPEHHAAYSPDTREKAAKGRNQYSDERNDLFLELVEVEPLDGGTSPEGFWFTDLLRLNLLGTKARLGNQQHVAERQAWLRQWGYGDDDENAAPFFSQVPGLLIWSTEQGRSGVSTGRFISYAQQHTGKVFIPVEPLYAAATFGLLALDLLTSTGMRSSELLQVNLLPECLVRLVDEPPPGARDQSPRIRYVLRLLPKGERTETRHNYGIGKETVRLLERAAQLLCDHYQLRPGEPLPRVVFDSQHSRGHRFEGMAVPYIFQYNHMHFSAGTLNSCLRFLLHGMVFQTSEGAPVVIKPHLLRHAFATFAVHVEGLPIDLVAKWLQQKNLEVTGYYSEMPGYMQVEQHASFVARLATQINVREAILRSPEEIQKQAEAARKRVGMLVPVCGGDCTLDVYCPNQFDCIHCPAKAPDPEKRYQVEEKRRWAEERLAYYEREGLVLEAEKMRQLIRACDLELREMEQIVSYRKDETRVIQIQPRPKRPS